MIIRLQKAIAAAGVASRRKAEQLILEGRVLVNNSVVDRLGAQVDPDVDHIKVDGKAISTKRPVPVIYALYKPKACVTTLDDPQGRDTIVNYFPKNSSRLFPVGRLDYDAEGLVLLTNDGLLSQNISHPSKHIWKQYFVKVKGKVQPPEIKKLRSGPVIDGKKRQPVKIKLLHYVNEKTWLVVSLQEGIKHHIKLMFKSIGYPVQKIKRYSIGNVELNDMRPGECRRLTPEEVATLLSLTQGEE